MPININIITTAIPSCSNWKEVARFVKSNLNLRELGVTRDGAIGLFTVALYQNENNYKNCVWFTEIVGFFKASGLSKEDAWTAARSLEDMGFVDTLDSISSPRKDWIMKFLV